MSQKIRCLLVGIGGLTHHMLRSLQEKPWYQTAGIVDVRPEALQQTGQNLELPQESLFSDLQHALGRSQADVAIINTPSELHYHQAKAALEAGVHVLVAKPITNDFAQAVELVELARVKNLTLAVGQQIRYNRHYKAVQQFIESGALGSVEAVFFFNSKPRHQALNLANMAQPALIEMSCHHFDSLLSLFPGHAPEKISCDGFKPSWSVYNGACMVNATIILSGNIHVLYHGGFSSQADMYELRLEGSRGALRCRGIHMSNDAMSYEFASIENRQWQPIEIDEGIAAADPFLEFIDTWHEYLQSGTATPKAKEPPFSGRNNLRVYALLDAGMKSVESGQPLAVASNARYAAAFKNSKT